MQGIREEILPDSAQEVVYPLQNGLGFKTAVLPVGDLAEQLSLQVLRVRGFRVCNSSSCKGSRFGVYGLGFRV